MRKLIHISLCVLFAGACGQAAVDENDVELARNIKNDKDMQLVLDKSRELLKGRFQAGSAYSEVWIRDFATFAELTCEVNDPKSIKEKLFFFFDFQADDGNIVDAYVPKKDINDTRYEFRTSKYQPDYVASKNSVETDQESSLVLSFAKYIEKTGDTGVLREDVHGMTVLERLGKALSYVRENRFSEKYGLVFGATTADWGDVQPEHEWGIFINEDTHWSIDIYDNALYVMAISSYLTFLKETDPEYQKWADLRTGIKTNVRKYLWDGEKFIPHIYLDGSPFPADFDEKQIFYFGGTTTAIQAGLLTPEEVKSSFDLMIATMKKAKAQTLGLTIYPPYPAGFFKNPDHQPFIYMNAGDWPWWGGRVIQAMVENGFVGDAYREIQPMVKRVIADDGFYEWYSIVDQKPHGSGKFAGAAGVLGKAIEMLDTWADAQLPKK